MASLNHNNIATIHGLEHDAGVHFLAMELIAGENLAARIARGAIPTEDEATKSGIVRYSGGGADGPCGHSFAQEVAWESAHWF